MKKCDKCGREREDVLSRLFHQDILKRTGFFNIHTDQRGAKTEVTFDPALCATCCSEMPGREWMKTSAQQIEAGQ